ncbi:MAG: pyridoxamine 5'-phosphate oxidase family protein [Chitinophagaceae bacterium]|nr:pyridoxamine 5'-phosphate oxidase family protein [Chitinophagaceae bacterium]
MGDFHNVAGQEAIKKIANLIETSGTCMFQTNLDEIPASSRPMATRKVEEDGSIWFFSPADSSKNMDISVDDRVQLVYINNSSFEYLSLYGTVSIIKDSAKAKELWNPILKTWFNNGPEDCDVTLLKFTPLDGYYWDTKNNKMVSMVKIAIGAISGKKMDDGREGSISVD